ncbi:MAG: archaellin/type IV pilin N-terminal domain-containing protein [Nitrososphaerales archaeon]
MTADTNHDRQFNRTKKGISPVVATVILVAVAVVIAAALAGFSGSLFTTYSSSGSVSIKTMTIDIAGDGFIEMANKGALADSVASIHVPGSAGGNGTGQRPALVTDDGTWTSIYLDGNGDCSANAEAPQIEANSEATVCFVDVDIEPGADGFIAGQQLTVRIKMTSGSQLTQSVVVQP